MCTEGGRKDGRTHILLYIFRFLCLKNIFQRVSDQLKIKYANKIFYGSPDSLNLPLILQIEMHPKYGGTYWLANIQQINTETNWGRIKLDRLREILNGNKININSILLKVTKVYRKFWKLFAQELLQHRLKRNFLFNK